MKTLVLLCTVLELASPHLLLAIQNQGSAPSTPRPSPQSANQKATRTTTGDDVFQANCQRCHMPPMSISPRITGTVLMHMRTRARLSREDELKLLRFMAP